jgi:hypothetical protein
LPQVVELRVVAGNRHRNLPVLPPTKSADAFPDQAGTNWQRDTAR